jgi:transposase
MLLPASPWSSKGQSRENLPPTGAYVTPISSPASQPPPLPRSGLVQWAFSGAPDKDPVRQNFDKALTAQGKHSAKPTSYAQQGMNAIQALYRIERQANGMTSDQPFEFRQAKAKPIIDDLRVWLDQALLAVPPSSLTGNALNYLHNQWPKLLRYLEDGRLSIDNNLVENIIRPFVISRKASLFCDSVEGAKATATLFSIIESAKANGHEPYHYLRYVISRLPSAKTLKELEALLPYNLTPEQVNRA